MSDTNLRAISESTNVKLGAVCALFIFIGGMIWWIAAWTATITAKVDSLITITSSYRIETEALKKSVSDLDIRVRVLEQHKP